MSTPTTVDVGSFHFTHDSAPGESLLCGFSEFGLAGLTAVDYLVDHLDLEQAGHVAAAALPAITPFENGTPRHYTRLFSRPELDVTVLVGEAAVRLVETASEVYGLDIDTGPLEAFAAEVADHYAQLDERFQEAPERERPDDRMFM